MNTSDNWRGRGRWTPGRVLLVLLLGQSAQGMEIEQLQTRFYEREYQLSMTATLNAPLARVEQVLRDYAAYPQLDSRILMAQVLARPAPQQLELFTRINVCFTFVCRKVERVERVEERSGELLATVIPERSDAERGTTHTELVAQGAQTRLIYTTRIVPKFWVPPWGGRALMLRSLRDATVHMFERIEQRAGKPS